MPLRDHIFLEGNIQVFTWQIEESLEDLKSNILLSTVDQERLNMRKSVQHQKGFLATRKLILHAGIDSATVKYNPNGAPFLDSGKHLSITHSKTQAGIAVGDHSLGFDIEEYHLKIQNIAPKFLHKDEYYAIESLNPIETLTRIWTAKEALYKALNIPGISFSKQLLITPFQADQTKGNAEVRGGGELRKFSLDFILNKDHCATLAVENK
jgi:phosphopantetheinyl transferase